jgi:hypothetical protein
MLVAVFAVAGVMSASAFASSAPTVVTDGFVHEAGLGLENLMFGTVNPNGLETTDHFEYGPTTSYGSSTSSGKAGSGTGNVEAISTAKIKAGSVYHYRLVATNADGTSYGTDRTTAPSFNAIRTFSGKSGGTVSIEVASGDHFSCSNATINGEVINATEVHATIKLSGCTGGATCSNMSAGEIETAHLVGELGWITATEAGLRLKPEKGTEFAGYHCNWGGGAESAIKVTGSVIAPIRNTVGKESLIYNFEQGGGKPHVTRFEDGLTELGLEAQATGFVAFSGGYAFATELSLGSLYLE